MKKLLCILLLIVFIFSSWAENTRGKELANLDNIVEYGLENNPDLDSAAYDLWVARENLTGTIKLDQTTLTGEGLYDYSPLSETGNLSSSIRLNMPFTDQVSLFGSWDLEQTATAGINVEPLNLTSKSEESEGALEKAEIRLNYLTRALEADIISAVLNYQIAGESAALNKEASLLAEKKYQAGYALYSGGEITYDDLQDLGDDLTKAQKQEIESQIALTNSKSELILLLGPEAGLITAQISVEELEEQTEVQNTRINNIPESRVTNSSLELAIVEYNITQAKLDNTLVFQPDLVISSEAVFTNGQSPSWKAGIALTLTPDNFDRNERNLIEEERNRNLRNIQIESFKLDVEKEAAWDRTITAEKETILARVDLERRETIYNETVLLKEQGERTSIELENAYLSFREGELNLFKALISLYRARADVLALTETD